MNAKRFLTTFKRKIKWSWLKIKSSTATKRNDERARRPKKLTESQNCALNIAVKAIHDPASKLYYDLHTQECYVKRDDDTVGTIYVFIESANIKIINTVFGYDIYINADTENYITTVFRKEMAKRRAQFKNEALAKVDHSLHKVLDRINS